MNRTSSRLPESKPDVEKAKRIYRAAVETIRRLDDIQRQKKAYRDVFRQDAVGLRTRLKEFCERLMFYDPALYGRKAEEVLWRKVFYDIIQLIKHNKRHIRPNSSVENAFRTHLAAATGYYYHILFRLQQEFNLNFNSILDFYLLPPTKSGSRFVSHRKRESEKAIKEWATKACHRCLVYLGDIARYQHSFGDGFSQITADRYYHQALALFPDLGMPHNQLGTMAGSRYYNCEAAFHYIRCLVSELSFEGAMGNLDRLFEKSSRRFQEVAQDAPRDLPPDQQRHRDVKRFLVRFMYLLSIFFKNSQSYDSYEIQDQCQRALQDFDLCMYYEHSLADGEETSEHHPSYLGDDIVFKIVIISMAAIYYQQKNGSRQVAASIAFLLALASHILNHAISRLQRVLQEAENPTTLPHVDAEEFQLGSAKREHCVENGGDVFFQNGAMSNVRCNEGCGDNAATKEDSKQRADNKQAQKKRKASRLRSLRRRRCRESDSSDDSCGSSLEESDLSEGGEGSDDDISLSDESDDDFIDCLAHDSDSDFEENLDKLDNSVDSQNHHYGLDKKKTGSMGKLSNGPRSASQELLYNNNTDSGSSPSAASDGANSGPDQQLTMSKNVWSREGVDDNLILFSSELFTASSSSTKILAQNIRSCNNSLLTAKSSSQINGDGLLPNGDTGSYLQQKHTHHQDLVHHEEELQERLDSFVIETDTETVIPTDTETSMNPSDSEADTEVEEQSSVSSNPDKWDGGKQSLLLEVIQTERLLPVVKVICDWMKCHAHVVTTCAQSSQSLWNRLAVLLNFLPTEEDITQDASVTLTVDGQLLVEGIGDLSWQQCLPLTEDINLHCFIPLHDAHSSIDFSAWSRAKVKEDIEHVLRVSCLRQFGYYLSNLPGVDFNYQPEEKIFLGPSQAQSPIQTKTTQDRMVSAETRRNQLMRDMAQLRLQAEVNQLEGSLQSEDAPTFPPYLIPDSSSLCDTLPVIRQLTQTARCIIIIPLAVIDTLDMMKKESSGAREAIRWLEGEFRRGNRYIRAQKVNEQAGMPPKPNLKKKHRAVWCLQELLNCGSYLCDQSGQLGGSSVITILTAGDVGSLETSAKVQSLIHTSKRKGISIENIQDFQTRWRDILEGKG